MLRLMLLAFLGASSLGLAGCGRDATTGGSAPEDASAPQALRYASGAVLSVIALDPLPGDEPRAAREAYLARALAIAGPLGLSNDMTLRVTETAAGDFSPAAYALFSWPNEAAEAEFSRHADWPSIKAMRPEGWRELRIYSVVLEDDLTLEFQPGKFYTVAAAWFSPENPSDYDRYLQGIEPTLATVGGRFIYRHRRPRYEFIAGPRDAPGQLTFVEWDSEEALDRFLDSEGFKTNAALLQSGVTRFELHRIAPVPR